MLEACPGIFSSVSRSYLNHEIVFEHRTELFTGVTRVGFCSKGCAYKVLPSQWGSWCNPTRSISALQPTLAILTQGTFHKSVLFEDVKCGFFARKALNQAALPWRPIMHTAVAAARHFLAPSLEVDLYRAVPGGCASVISTADVINVSVAGSEPNIMGPCEEDVAVWGCPGSSRALLTGSYPTSPAHVYTIGICSAALDLQRCALNTPVLGEVALPQIAGPQPLIPYMKVGPSFLTAFEICKPK